MSNQTRAADADRNRTIERVESAYVDGQLDAEERDRRVARALRAKRLAELGELVADLQPGPVAPEPTPSGPRTSSRVARVAWAVGGVLALFVGWQWLGLGGSSDRAVDVSTSALSEAPSAEPIVPEPRTTVESLREFRSAYEQKFGTDEVYELWIHDDHLYVEVPVRGTRPRWEGWTWKTGDEWFQMYLPTRRSDAADGLVGLGDVDFAALMRNVKVGVRSLNVPHARFSHALVDSGAGYAPRVSIFVDNTYDEVGVLDTTLGGRITGRIPFEG